jgi:hypothetical protein
MLRIVWPTVALVAALALATPPLGADDKKEPPANKNTLVTKHKDKLKVSASSMYGGYPVTNLIDGKSETAWFSANDDSVAKGNKPWVEIEFPEDVAVTRVTVLGNRDKDFPKNFSVLEGKIELLDKDGKSLHSEEGKGVGETYDFDFALKKEVKGVRKVRFVPTKDQGDKNAFGDVALGEIQIE